jgi:IS1 family transposase
LPSKLISLEHSLDHILERARTDDFEPETAMKSDIESLAEEEKAEVNVAFHMWEKVKQTEISKNTGRAKCDKTMRMVKNLPAKDLGKIVLEDYEDYKNHLERDHVIKKELKKERIEAEEEEDKAVIHMDWAEQHTLIENNIATD